MELPVFIDGQLIKDHLSLPGIIYRITNKINNKVYIGRAINGFNQRYVRSEWWINNHNRHLRYAIEKYGLDNFDVHIIDVIGGNNDELNKAESQYIETYNANISDCGYNLTSGGDCVEHNQETKDRISETLTEMWKDPELRKRNSQSTTDWWYSLTPEQAGEILEKRANTKSDPEWRKYLSECIINGHSVRSIESRQLQSDRFRATIAAKSPEEWSKEVNNRLDKLQDFWDNLPAEERASKLTNRNAKISETLKNKSMNRLPLNHDVTVLLVTGPFGIGKSWLCSHLSNDVKYIPYDGSYRRSFEDEVYIAARDCNLILIDMPIKASTFINKNKHLYNIIPVFIEEEECVHKSRLESRGGTWTGNITQRREALKKRANEYAKFRGTSDQCLNFIKVFITNLRR